MIILVSAVACDNIGVIAYFDNICPEGWVELDIASGRLVMGLNSSYSLNQTGGSATHAQTKEEMAVHSHKNRVKVSHGDSKSAAGTYPVGTTLAASANR